MARRRNSVPKYELHKPSGNARVRWCGHERWLGKHGTPESLKEYARVCAEIGTAANPAPLPDRHRTSVAELLLAFMEHAERHYRAPDGTLTSEFREHARSIVHLQPLYGHTPAAEFGPVALQTVRTAMVAAGWCRSVVNKRIGRVRRIFRWAVAQEVVPVAVAEALACVQGLQKGRTAAPETEPVLPAPLHDVEKVLPFLDRHQRTMAQLQLFTGMRPGEVCVLRLCELDRPAAAGAVWTWRPDQHKTAWRGKEKVILFGPKAQAVITEFLNGGLTPSVETDWLFRPWAAREEHLSARKARRVCKVYPSERQPRKTNPKREPGARYNVGSYGHALVAACEKAGVPKFLPNQLRHTFATEVRRVYGLEAAQVLLGHAKADVTQLYAERNLTLALRVAGEIG